MAGPANALTCCLIDPEILAAEWMAALAVRPGRNALLSWPLIFPTIRLTFTGSAHAPTVAEERIRVVVKMTLRTMRLSFLVCPTFSAPVVFCYRYDFQMIWIYAFSVAAQMVDMQTIRNWAFV